MYTGRELKVLRELLGIELKDAAYIVSCTQRTIEGIESGTISEPRVLKVYNWYLSDMSHNDIDLLLRFDEKLKRLREEGAL